MEGSPRFSPFIPPVSPQASISPISSEGAALDILPIPIPPPSPFLTPPTHGPDWPSTTPLSSPSRASLLPDDPHQSISQQLHPEISTPSPVEQRVVSFAETPSIIPTSSLPINWMPHEDIATHRFFFNLSAPKFAPMRFGDAGKLDYVLAEELKSPATNPPIYRLRIVCNLIPQWPIIFQPNLSRLPETRQVPPITIGDILAKIYYCMHLPIQEEDWEQLPKLSQLLVTKTFQRRCRLSGPEEEEEKSKGVKRIDFCWTHVWLDGLVRLHSEDGPAVMLLKLAEGSSE